MRTISQMLTGTQTLQTGSAGEAASTKATPDTERVELERLENVYRQVPVIFNGINKYAQTILSNGWHMENDPQGYFEKFLGRVGEIGGNQHWDEILGSIIRYQLIYGRSFVELIENKSHDRIVDLALIDPKTMDYAMEQRDKIALDKYGNPIGYSQEIPFEKSQLNENQVYPTPDRILDENTKIFIPAENIAHFKLYTMGEGFYGIGLVEPVFKSAERSYQLQEDYANRAHTVLFPRLAAKVGDLEHQPTPKILQKMKEEISKVKSSTEWSLPYYVDLEMLEAENPESLLDFFKHFDEQATMGMGIPKPIATGAGEDTNRATLDILERVFRLSIKDIISRTRRTIETQIFEKIAQKNDVDPARFVWEVEQPVNKEEVKEGRRSNQDLEEIKDVIDILR